MWLYFIPLYVLAVLVLLWGSLALLGRIRGGRYARPIVATLMRLPLAGRLLKRVSRAALERQNPELASAIRKLERSGVTRDPQRAQVAMSRMTAAERRAYLEAAGEQEAIPAASNRAMRRRLERMQKNPRRRG
jgi:hypothetical protein